MTRDRKQGQGDETHGDQRPRSPGSSQDALTALGDAWRRERHTVRQRYVEERRGTTLAERVARGIALRELSVIETDAAPGGRTLLWIEPARPREAEDARIGVGDPVRLWWDDPDAPDAVRGTVSRRRGARLGVVVDGDFPERLEEGSFNLDREEPEATFDRGDRAVARFRDAADKTDEGRLRAVLFGERAPASDPPPSPDFLDASLNQPQREAVVRALAARDVALIHGPPGTGKTRTLVEVIRQAVRRGERVLATAASNTAVDNLAERLVAEGVSCVRLGHPARVSPAMESRTLDALLEATEAWTLSRKWIAEANALRRRAAVRRSRGSFDRDELRGMWQEARALMNDARKHVSGEQQAILGRAQVICSTAAGSDVALLGGERFDLVVLDEATQAPDPIALCALARARRAVLAGDPRQLPPTVISGDPLLGVTLFERLAASAPEAVRMLVVQHRMHETIMRFPSESMYEGRLVAAPEVAAHTLADLGVAVDPLRPGPFVFIDTAGKGWSERREGDDPSTSNPTEAERVAAEARRLLARGLPPVDLAVITPYDAQARLLRDLLAAEVRAGLEIGTVDGFQGREKEAILVDLVRSNDDRDIGFLADVRRMNVALTRARRFLLVVGDGGTLGHHPYYQAFLDAAERAGGWVSAWSDDAPPW